MIVKIEGRINVDGQWWDIVTEHSISTGILGEQKVDRIKAIIRGITSTSEIISRVGANESPGSPQTVTVRPEVENGTQSTLFTWPVPHCGIHNGAMKMSSVQKDPAKVSFFCPKRHGQDYCKHRAKVDSSNGIPAFFEVK